MTASRKHIGFLLFVAFVVPTTFQPAHVIWHHSAGQACEHHCHHNGSEKAQKGESENLSEQINPCPICEYQFSLVDLTEFLFFTSRVPVSARIHSESIPPPHIREIFFGKTPRAPPFS